jgi:hypothetical protein
MNSISLSSTGGFGNEEFIVIGPHVVLKVIGIFWEEEALRFKLKLVRIVSFKSFKDLSTWLLKSNFLPINN